MISTSEKGAEQTAQTPKASFLTAPLVENILGHGSLHIFRLSDVADINAQKSDRVREKRLLEPSSSFCFRPYMTANICIESGGQVWSKTSKMPVCYEVSALIVVFRSDHTRTPIAIVSVVK